MHDNATHKSNAIHDDAKVMMLKLTMKGMIDDVDGDDEQIFLCFIYHEQ